MNLEHRLIAKVIRSGDYGEIIRQRIEPRMFKSADARQMFKAIGEYYKNPAHFGRVPHARWMKEHFPSFEYLKSRETIPELCESLRQKAMARVIAEGLEDTSRVLHGDGPYEALNTLRAHLIASQSFMAHSRDVILAESTKEVLRDYRRTRNAKGLLGVPWPWKEMNVVTQGMQPEEFILMYARMKSMKSWLAIKMATHAYEIGNRRVLFYSCEMPSHQVRRRVVATLCGLDYDLLRRAKLSVKELEPFVRRMRGLKKEELRNRTETHHRSFMITTDKDDPSGGGVNHLLAKIEQFKPHIAFVDSFYRMRNDRNGQRSMKWQDQAAITQDLKHAAQQAQIPVVGITQRNRDKETSDMGDVSYTDASGQETDLGLRIVKGGIDPGGHTKLSIYVAGAREIKADGFRLKVIPSTMWEWDGWIQQFDENGAEGRVGDQNEIGEQPKVKKRKGKAKKKGPARESAGVSERLLDDLGEDLDIDV